MNDTKLNRSFPRLRKQGLYDPWFEHDACGVGLVANIKGLKSHDMIAKGLEVLINLGHRGAAGADPDTGDGAGLLIQIPHEFFARETVKLGIDLPAPGNYAVATVFLPQDIEERKKCEDVIESTVRKEGYSFLGWRDVPTCPEAIGELAQGVMPAIRQFFVSPDSNNCDPVPFELRLYVIRRQIENVVSSLTLSEDEDFYICSLSSNTIVYKGLILAHQ